MQCSCCFFFIILRRTDGNLCHPFSAESEGENLWGCELFLLFTLPDTHSYSLLDLFLRASVIAILKVRSMLHVTVTIFLVIFQASQICLASLCIRQMNFGLVIFWFILGLPWWLTSKESVCAGDRLDSWVRKIPWREA